MVPHILLSLLLFDGPAPLPAAPVQTLDLAKLTFRDARRLEGQAVRVSFVVDSLPADDAASVLVDAESLPGISATIHFVRGLEPDPLDIGSRFTAEGQLRVRLVPGRRIDGECFPDALVVDVVGARPVKP